ncbi:MAG: DUF4382 domain-containing protein [Candidatus Aminicenantes bacterium]|nr:MAG: DUF4382 domain-containing protein [Candidatus Aminicenantes bacterium]
MKRLALFAISAILLLGGCSTSENSGNFQLYLTDQPIDGLEHVYVTISAIKVQKDDSSVVTLWQGTETYDLLALRDVEELVVDVDLEAGTYTHIIVVIHAVSIVVYTNTYDLSINPGLEVRIPVSFTILDNDSTEVVLDFEVDSSLEGYGDQYIFIPVISVDSIR